MTTRGPFSPVISGKPFTCLSQIVLESQYTDGPDGLRQCFCRVFCFVSFAAGASFALVGSFRYFPNLEISGDSGSRCSLIKWRMPTFGLHWRLRSTWSTWSLATKMAWKTSCLWHMILKRLQKWLVSCPLAAWIPIKTNRFYPWDSFGSLLIIHDFTMFF